MRQPEILRELVRDEIGHSISLAVPVENLTLYSAAISAGISVLERSYPNIILNLLGSQISPSEMTTLIQLQNQLQARDGKLLLVTEAPQVIDALQTDGRTSYAVYFTIKEALASVLGL